MKNYVTFETAVKLKAAGFPQPEPEFGQVYFDVDGDRLIGLEKNFFFEKGLDAPSWISDNREMRLFFAPTDADILEGTDLQMWWNVGDKCFWVKAWPNNKVAIFSHKNPAEAAALAWLALNEKNPEP